MKKLMVLSIMAVSAFCCTVLFACSPNIAVRDISGVVNIDSIGEIRIYSFDGEGRGMFLIPNLGHAWISVKNLSDDPFVIAGYTVDPDEELTIGTWAQEAYWGIWFNLESYYLKNNLYKGNVSVGREIADHVDLEILNSYTKDKDTWNFSQNCTLFALGMWNTIAREDKMTINGIITPAGLKAKIKEFKTYEAERMVATAKNPSLIQGGKLIEVTPK